MTIETACAQTPYTAIRRVLCAPELRSRMLATVPVPRRRINVNGFSRARACRRGARRTHEELVGQAGCRDLASLVDSGNTTRGRCALVAPMRSRTAASVAVGPAPTRRRLNPAARKAGSWIRTPNAGPDDGDACGDRCRPPPP